MIYWSFLHILSFYSFLRENLNHPKVNLDIDQVWSRFLYFLSGSFMILYLMLVRPKLWRKQIFSDLKIRKSSTGQRSKHSNDDEGRSKTFKNIPKSRKSCLQNFYTQKSAASPESVNHFWIQLQTATISKTIKQTCKEKKAQMSKKLNIKRSEIKKQQPENQETFNWTFKKRNPRKNWTERKDSFILHMRMFLVSEP